MVRFHPDHLFWSIAMIEIDGTYGEGGGQILRTSLTLSALTGTPVHIHHIRAHRTRPGLRPQHLAAVQAIVSLTQAEVQGGILNSPEISLWPSRIRAGRYRFTIPTAGAAPLVLQTVFLPLSFARGRSLVSLTGGTHVPWSPTVHYLQGQWLPVMKKLGFKSEISLQQAGFYPRGGGEMSANILPTGALNAFTCIDRGELIAIRGFSGVANLPDAIASRQKHQALKRLYAVCENSKIKTLRMPSYAKGTFILLAAEFSNGGSACYTALGSPGKPAERVADEAVDPLLSFLSSNGCVDRFLADQLLLPLSLVSAISRFRTDSVSQHLITNAHVIRQFLPVQIDIDGEHDEPGLITVRGTDLSRLPLNSNSEHP